MSELIWLLIIATSIWVVADAKSIGVKSGQIKGLGNMGPWGWFFASLLFWIVGFPLYLAKRGEFKRINSSMPRSTAMGLKTCPFCAEEIQSAAIVCKHCNRDLPAQTSAEGVSGAAGTITRERSAAVPTAALKQPVNPIVVLFSVVVAGVVLYTILDGSSSVGESTPAATSKTAASSSRSVTSLPAPEVSLTVGQRNAARSAKSYLAISGFSRQGLIGQLSSEFGDRFSVEDATAAVDSLNIDWNTQAARSAAAYLKISGFSCRGLIDQLSSQSGDKYTVAQATYGATQAGVC